MGLAASGKLLPEHVGEADLREEVRLPAAILADPGPLCR